MMSINRSELISEISIIRARPNAQNQAFYLVTCCSLAAALTVNDCVAWIKNVKFTDRAPAGGRSKIHEFFTAHLGADIVVDNHGFDSELDWDVCMAYAGHCNSRVFRSAFAHLTASICDMEWEEEEQEEQDELNME